MSTPSRFLKQLRKRAGEQITTVRRGDWQDWWSDGVCSTPELLAANQQAKRILADLPAAARIVAAANAVGREDAVASAWLDAVTFDEHTWGSYNSIAQPYDVRTAGGIAEKAVLAYRAAERTKQVRAATLRSARDYSDFSRTRRFRVLNPGATVRSGWVAVPATAIRFSCNAARDLATGKVYALEDVRGPEWSDPDLKNAPFDRPNDVWAWQVQQRRFWLARLQAGETRDFELTTAEIQPSADGCGLTVVWDESRGRVASLRAPGGQELVDSKSAHGLGCVLVETVKDRGQRPLLASRDREKLEKQFVVEPVKLRDARRETTQYASSLVSTWEHPRLVRVEQRWDVCKDLPRAMLTTTIWTRETADPCAIYLAFPLALPDAQIAYDSVGHETIFGRDSMPGTCAEALCHNAGLIFRDRSLAVLLASPDTPLGCVGGTMLRRKVIAPFNPANGHYYINVTNNYWHTNFSILKAGKLVLRHWIETTEPASASLPMLSDELWAYPIAEKTP